MRGGARCNAQCNEIYSNIDFDEIMIEISMFAKMIGIICDLEERN